MLIRVARIGRPATPHVNSSMTMQVTLIPGIANRRLVKWTKWGHKHCEASFFDALNKAGRHKTWFIYFGTIAADRFTAVEVHGEPLLFEPAAVDSAPKPSAAWSSLG